MGHPPCSPHRLGSPQTFTQLYTGRTKLLAVEFLKQSEPVPRNCQYHVIYIIIAIYIYIYIYIYRLRGPHNMKLVLADWGNPQEDFQCAKFWAANGPATS